MNSLFELTDQQKNIWNSEVFYSGTNINNIGGYLLLNEKVNIPLLQKAANIYVQTTEISCMHFDIKDAKPVQFLTEYKPFSLDVMSLNNIDDLKALTTRLISEPFETIDKDLYKFKLFTLSDGRGGIIPIFHHLITDAWSMSLFISTFIDIYTKLLHNDTNFEKKPLYTNYIASCNEYKKSNRFIKDKEFWESNFENLPELTYISKNKNNSNSASKRKICFFEASLYDAILEYCKENKCSIYTFFMAIFSIYLAKINSTKTAILGTPVLNRSNFTEKNTSGMFVSTVPFKIDIDFNLKFNEFLNKVSNIQTSIFRHQKYPYLELLEHIKQTCDISDNLYDFVLSYQNARDNKNTAEIDYESTWEPISNIGDSIDAHFYDMDGTGEANIFYDYQISKFSEKDIELLHSRICEMAKFALQNPQISNIEVTSPEDNKIISDFNNTSFKYDKNTSLISLFSKVVKLNENSPAIIFKGAKLTFKELDEKSNQVANLLLNYGIEKQDSVGIMFNRSFDLLIAIWGVLKVGASYMLIDPSLPQDRVQYMLENASSKLVLTNLYINYPSINIEHRKQFSTCFSPADSSNDDRFCIIYTSGSTGKPKGVELKRIGIINMLNSYKQLLKTNDCKNFLSTSTVAFDMFIVENFVSILDGKTVVLADEEEQKIPAFTSKLIKENHVDFILSTPSKISLLLEEPDCLKDVKVIQLGGEVFKPSLYKRLRENTSAKIYNGYGPSECTACASNKKVKDDNITIGKPFLNTEIYIMNKFGNILPSGVCGEIVIKGDGVGKGYVNKFDFNGTYHTGDLGILSSDGELIYLGRQDNQIKLHGLRIELDEITSKIMQIPEVTNAISVIKKVNNIDCICSYIKADSKLDENYVKDFIARSLPKYMIPSHIMQLSIFPITLNGKIDTKNLPEIQIIHEHFVPCETDFEKKLENILKPILDTDKISATANIFDWGMDSLSVIRLVSEIYSTLNIKLNIQDIYNMPSIKELSSLLEEKNSLSYQKIVIKKHKEADSYPVSSAQRRIFYTVNMETESLAYNTPFGVKFRSKPDISKLEKCLAQILNMHDAFKTYFVLENNDVVQKLVKNIDFHLTVNEYDNENFIRPFDLSKAPLVHVELDQFDDSYLLKLDIHHIICDGTSISIFAKELCDLYNGNQILKSELDYIDYAVSETISEDDKLYWKEQFSAGIPLLNMPTEFERTNIKSEEGANVYASLDKLSDISTLCKKYNITPYMFFLSCFYILLYKYTMQNDITVGSPVIGRNSPEISNVIGMFVNTLPLKQNIHSASRFSVFLEAVKKNCLNAFNHQTYPFDDLVKTLNVIRDPSRSPIFDVLFTYESGGRPSFSFDGEEVEYVIPENKTSKFDFSLEVTPISSGYNFRLEYSTNLYSEKFMKTLLDCYFNIINSCLVNPDIQISKIQMLSKIPYIYPTLDYPRDFRVIDMFENQVKLTPNKIALVCKNEQYTYKELEVKVNRLANKLRTFEKKDVIGIMMNRSNNLIISMLAILKSGAGYLPIDPTYPEERVSYIIENSGVDLILTENNLKDLIPTNYLLVDDEANYLPYSEFNTEQGPKDLAYLIYTSGSTGKPKGVMIKQYNVVNFIYGCLERMPLEGKTIVSITTMCFDIFVFESLLPLCTGMKVVMATNEEQNNPILLNELCLKNNVDVIQTTPSKFKLLINDELPYLKELKIVSLIGEPFPLELLKRIKELSDTEVYNMYGPTETTVGSTLKDLTNTNDITIGTPLANTHVLVLDNDMNFVPYYVPGTLYIGGDGVTLGYKNRPELTSEKFIKYNNEIIYNSGDLAKLLPNGELICLGRTDFQVKVRGLRIELGEIERAICSYEGISDAVVTVKTINNRELLCGYFVASGRVPYSTLKKALAKKLPNYMVPNYMLQLESFKYTPNGKIDRKALPDPVFKTAAIVRPKSELESKILNIWRDILSLEEISTEDNFFDIGGDSLSALKMQIELMKNNITVNYGDIFKNNTIHDLANFVENNSTTENLPTYTPKDFKKIDKLLKKNSAFGALKLKQKIIKNVLLVGATGFLGIHVLAELLKIDDIKIYCLIREDPSTSPENKLKRKFQYYFGSDLSNLFGTRLFVISGDITNDKFKVSNEIYNFLGKEVSSVINCAASVKHYGYYKDFEKINVTGAKNLVKFCEEFNKELYHTSTISVSGNTLTGVPSTFKLNKIISFGETNLFIKQPLDNVYVRSKFEAEKFILDEISSKKLKGVILRIGNITNRYSDGKFQENSNDNAFLNRLKAFIYLKEIPLSLLDKYVEFSPVDKIAESIVVCMKYYTSPMSVLHLYNSKHLFIQKFIEYLNNLGYDISVVDDFIFNRHLNNVLFNSSNSDKVSVLLNDLNKDKQLLYKTNLKITNTFTLKFLDKADFYWPEITKEYIEKILKNI